MADIYRDALNKLAKWRTVLAGWQLGTRPRGDPECEAVRDHRELGLLLRAELTAVTRILLEKGVFTIEEHQRILAEEALQLDAVYEKKFPGFKTCDTGIVMDLQQAMETMRGWKP